MKKLYILIVALTVFQLKAFAQPYESIFAVENNQPVEWVFTWDNLSNLYVDTAFIEKDTVVNGINYRKVMTKYGSAAFKGGLLRENVDSGIVWYRDIEPTLLPEDTVEKIAFRFDLQAGDTFDISNAMLQNGSYPDSLNVVDSVRYINGLRHIYFKGQYEIGRNVKEPFTIIEGIGSNIGILWKHYDFSPMDRQYLLCTYKNKVKTSFVNRYYNGECYITSDIQSTIISSDNIKVYPTPTKNIVFIKNESNDQIIKAKLYNSTGQILRAQNNSPISQLNISDLSSGFYILKLQTRNGLTYIRPITKK